MKPILFSDTETTFDTNGIGVLTDAISCKEKQQLNGAYELTLKYPLAGIHAKSLRDRTIIVAKADPVSELQPFRVYRIVPSSKGEMTVYARHLAYDTMGIPVAPFSAGSAADAMAQAKGNAVTSCPFELSTDKNTAAPMGQVIPKSLWKTLGGSKGSILDTYGGEYEFDRYNIFLHDQRGADRGVSIRYGKNLTTLEQDRNCANVYTGVYPYWASTDDIVVQLPERYINAEGEYSFSRILTIDLTSEFDEKPTEEQLRERAQKYMTENNIGKPDVSWKIEFVALEQTDEYKGMAILEQVQLGDTVNVYFPDMDVDVSSRAVEVEYDSILERYNYIYLGKVRANIADSIVKQQQEIEKKPSLTVMQTIAASLSAAMMGAKGGCVRQLDTDGDGMPDEWYIADNSNPALAVKVWRFNYMGLAASKNGYNGPFEMGATFEDGILAHLVTAANLVAGTIKSQDGKTVFIDLDNGIVNLQPVTNAIDSIKNCFRVDSTGLNIGAEGEEASLQLTAGVLKVLLSGSPVAIFDRYGVKAEQADIQTLIMGEFTLSIDKTRKILTLC